jgi:hypothetical protein
MTADQSADLSADESDSSSPSKAIRSCTGAHEAIATAQHDALDVVTRRTALSLSLAGFAALLDGCGGGGSSDGEDPGLPSVWTMDHLYFTVGSGAKWDLAPGLPAHVVRGGTFGVSPSGAALPAGMRLSRSGILAVGSANPGTVVGVVFTYDEPAQ